ncbi:MAG: glycoside hydrolase family 2 [Oscillospiraceae bacterium]|nr:glycoside hydrolase family 2 [Oscillospiraceae bacterium]
MEYQRSFRIPDSWNGMRILLHFGAVMGDTAVSVNGVPVCTHRNGYLPFDADITDQLHPGENTLCVQLVNDLDPVWPWGKQSVRRGGMWYTPCSGIWQTVWLEPVPECHFTSLEIVTGTDFAEITAGGISEGELCLDGKCYPFTDGRARIQLENPELWSPDHPHLYRFTLTGGGDSVESYFALRTLSIETIDGIPRLCLNGKPFFFHGLLDQGYWSDGLYTAPDPSCYETEIRAMKSLGFNMLRKHIKIEPEQFYYDCDRLGMIVFQDMVNNGRYRFFRDTLLPTLRLTNRRDEHLNPDQETRRVFLDSMEQTIRLLKNHPCICLWTVFNEGWGQFRADDAYRRVKEIDGSRWVDSTSGWFRQSLSDVESLHIYFGRIHLGRQKRPQFLSEYGGYVWKIPEHSFNQDKTYGYRIFRSRDDYIRGMRKLFAGVAELAAQGLCGAVYTQVSDVEDETNGLYTFDRSVLKIQAEEIRDLSDKICSSLQQQTDC